MFLIFETLYESVLRIFSPNLFHICALSVFNCTRSQKHLFFIFLLHIYFVRDCLRFSLYCVSDFQEFILVYFKIILDILKNFLRIFYLRRHLCKNIFESLVSDVYKR